MTTTNKKPGTGSSFPDHYHENDSPDWDDNPHDKYDEEIQKQMEQDLQDDLKFIAQLREKQKGQQKPG